MLNGETVAVGLRARVVTYGLVAVLALGVWNHVEAWPVTSYRLFSSVRTGRTVSQQLVAVRADGSTVPVRFTGVAVAATSHQIPRLRTLPVGEQRTQVLAWLDLAGIEATTVVEVRVERVIRELDPDGGPARTTGRTVLVRVPL